MQNQITRGTTVSNALTALFLAVLTGCGNQAVVQTQVQSNLKPLAMLYGQFTGRHRGQSPANEAEFKEFIKSLPAASLANLKITDTESLFTSTRDGEPYVIVYGGPKGPPGPGGVPVVAYERTGVGGKRFVATSIGAVEEVDGARFRELVPDAQ